MPVFSIIPSFIGAWFNFFSFLIFSIIFCKSFPLVQTLFTMSQVDCINLGSFKLNLSFFLAWNKILRWYKHVALRRAYILFWITCMSHILQGIFTKYCFSVHEHLFVMFGIVFFCCYIFPVSIFRKIFKGYSVTQKIKPQKILDWYC